MKKAAVITVLLSGLIYSCSKTTTPMASGEMYIPWNIDPLPMNKAYQAKGGVPLDNVSGILTACDVTGTFTDTTGTTNHYKRTWQSATLADSPAFAKVNAVDLTYKYCFLTGAEKIFLAHYDSVALWNEAATNTWTVNPVTTPSFSVNINGALPSFTGTLPDSLSATSDFDYTFNASNASGADSAYVVISNGIRTQSATVSANGGTAHIAASRLGDPISGTPPPPELTTTLEGKTYAGTLMMVVLYSHTYATYSGKRYAFVKQKVILHMFMFT